ncbi:MAG TPA: ABC transporter permease [Pyrinomonadaceae bacterium]|jgi:ABC-2 type transport system permease protein|nr:ABC transporter permease [Pyrinomonadaceae bacterium]
MNKLFAIIKREYVRLVRSKFFVIMTVLGPFLLVVFTVVPTLLFTIKTGETRIAVIDQTEGARLYEPIRSALLQEVRSEEGDDDQGMAQQVGQNPKQRMEKAGNSLKGSFRVEPVKPDGRALDDVRHQLNARIGQDQLDGYLVLPPDILTNSESKTAYYGRNVGDVITRGQIEKRLNSAVRRQRLIAQGVRDQDVDSLSKSVDVKAYPVNEKGQEGAEDSGGGFAVVFIIAFLIYITVLLYGQVVLGAIVEEKETRIAEILFSSVRPLHLMVGKLIGVSLMALTQLAIWAAAFGAVAAYALPALASTGRVINLPHLPLLFFVYFFLFFVLGYFIYATIYVLVGSMVTTTQEGGQMAMPIVFMLMAGLYMAFPVIRAPNSSFAFWVSMVPFFAPITMMVRIVSQQPPFWQIALSFGIGCLTVVGLLWLASRIYRIGMLMYGKKATIPEVVRWVRQS